MIDSGSCVVCGTSALKAVEGYSALQRVTSDCKPWPAGGSLLRCLKCAAVQKRLDGEWLQEIDSIYSSYTLFALAGGAEQLIFSGQGQPLPRSELLARYLKRSVDLPRSGKLLDVGCGTGAALRTLAHELPGWEFYGSELSDRSLPQLRQIPGFVELFTSTLDAIEHSFDVVTIIHALEHFVDPLQMMEQVRKLLKPNGVLLIQVPDLETSPFDLLITDHRTHFTKRTLAALLGRAGLAIESIDNSVLPKEISTIARRGELAAVDIDLAYEMSLVMNAVEWLHRVRERAQMLTRGTGSVGIFGTSISGIWCFSEIRDGVSFFVDEDPSKIGASYEGRRIVSPRDIPERCTVYVPLVPAIAAGVVSRLGAVFVAPPSE